MTNQDTALELKPKDEFLEIVERFMGPDVSPEKLKEMMELKFQWDAQQAEKAYWAAMIVAQREVKALAWDKFNQSNQSRNVSYPKIDRMLRPIREEHGFVQSFDTEPGPAANMMIMCLDVSHKDGHRQRYRLPMPIDGSGPKGGGVMSSQQAVGAGKSYGQRYLVTMAWDIPQLIDKDDTDGNPIQSTVSEPQLGELNKLFTQLPEDRKKKALAYLKVGELSELPASQYNRAINALTKAVNSEGQGEPASGHWSKNAKVNEAQVVTLQSLIDEVGGNCKKDFLKTNKIESLSELPASQYQACLQALTEQRRAT